MKALWKQWPRLRQQALSADLVVLLLDFDGTLAPIAEHPAKARLSTRTAHLLRRLARQPDVFVAVISGRALRNLKALVGIKGLCYVGNHGLELQGPTLRYVDPVARANRPLLKQIARSLTVALRSVPGAWIEDKGLTLSVHWRQTPPSAHRPLRRLISRATAPYRKQGAVRVTRGKRVIEIRPPVNWGKGAAVRWLLQRIAPSPMQRGLFIVYAGDDQTDEEAFRVVNRLSGLSVFVGNRPRASAARWRLNNSHDVHAMLAQLL
jgi:trehalose-phosphatase